MPGCRELPYFALFGALPVVFGSVGYSAAKRKGRNAWAWFFACLVGSVMALVILLVLPPLRATCPHCGGPFRPGVPRCPHCAAPLPDQHAAARYIGAGPRYALQCPRCGMPYRLEDYRPDAPEIRCDRCEAPLPREPPAEPAPPAAP